MEFFGENLLPGQLGHFFILLSLIASLAATVSYFFSTQKTDAADKLRWRNLARIFFVLEVVSIISIFGLLFYIISNHLFEYKYAWQHSSRSLEMKYLLSCFWEGQEGSFLLWSFWHSILGLVIIKKEKNWEAPVMTVVSFMQFCLATMILGIELFGLKIGSNPFVLLRNELEAPIFSRPDYLSLVTDGNDLNPLLQNYWMVIHPPVLFLGFAACLIPFAYAIAGLWKKDYSGWTKPALPWALFAAGVLGLGIMMGAAWAYESLNFGGYWAWDPVENASLVPWLILVAGIHTLLIYRHSGHALRSTFLFFILSFILVLYSTYLTRSGDLQDTSVHAFTDLGMTWQLRLFLFVFILPSFFLFFKRYKQVPHITKEEETSSREFWMFIGSLVFFLSAISIIIMTSLPVINKIIGLFIGEDKEVFKPLALGEDTA
ncbi:MAG TPA: cytochrome c biogenesis protein CcsA, partial [Chitinophagaceae bacterium]